MQQLWDTEAESSLNGSDSAFLEVNQLEIQ